MQQLAYHPPSSCVEDCFFIEMLDVPTINEALTDVLHRSKENLLCSSSLVSDRFGCADHNIVESGILLSTLRVVDSRILKMF